MTSGRCLQIDGHTSRGREWWGWLGCAVWLFFMMYGHNAFMQEDYSILAEGSSAPFFFMALLALSVAVFGWKFGGNPNGLSRVAFYTTPAVFVITAVFALLPHPLGSVIYAVSPVLMAPAVTRRLYGVVHTAGPGKRLARFMSGITVCVAAYTAWVIFSPPKEVAFLVPALLTVPVWLGIRRGVTLPKALPEGGAFRLSGKSLLLLAAAMVLLFWLDTMSAVIHTYIIGVGDENSELLYTLLGFVLPPVGFLMYGIVSDKGHERTGFICGMMLFFAGIVIAILPGEAHGPLFISLAFADGLGGSYIEFFILTFSIYFLTNTKRPVFAASLGLAIDLLSSALLWEADVWVPEVFRTFDMPLLVSAAVSAIGFVALVFFLFERHREKTFAAALYAVFRGEESAGAGSGAGAEASSAELPGEALPEAGFTRQEREIALLLIDGLSQHEISRRLRLSSGETGKHIKAIRAKIADRSEKARTADIARRYGLTSREAEALILLLEGKSTAEIAGAMSITEKSVRNYVSALLAKTDSPSRGKMIVKIAREKV